MERTADIALKSFFYIMSVLNHAEVPYEVIDYAEAITDKQTLLGPLESLLRGLATPKTIATAIEKPLIHAQHHGDATPGGKW